VPKVTVKLQLSVEGFDPVSKDFDQYVEYAATPDGIKYFMEEGVAFLKAELLYGQFYEELPSTKDLFPKVKNRTYSLDDMAGDRIENDTNKQELWRFIGNTTLAINTWLAKAKSIQELQKAIGPSNERLAFVLQHDKMDKLHLSVNAIANLRDLHKRLIMEGLGGIRLDITQSNGQKRPARSLKEALEHWREIDRLNALDDTQIPVLKEIADKLENNATNTTKLFLDYKGKLGHDAPQVVDNPIFYPQLTGRKWKAIIKHGKTVGKTKGMLSRRTKPDWTFDDIFKIVLQAFEHYLGTLRTLRSLTTFNPD
jgi:hypothetical protein